MHSFRNLLLVVWVVEIKTQELMALSFCIALLVKVQLQASPVLTMRVEQLPTRLVTG